MDRSRTYGRTAIATFALICMLLLSTCIPHPAEAAVPRAAEHYRRDLVRVARSNWGLDAPVATFAAQVHQESAWRRDAVSHAGAEGLAQFMPATSKWMADLYPLVLGPADPFNPGWSLRALVVYDTWLHKRVAAVDECNRWAMTLAAYNGGLGWVNRDRKLALDFGSSGLIWFNDIESHNAGRSRSAFTENRHYVHAILDRHEREYVVASWGPGVCADLRYQL